MEIKEILHIIGKKSKNSQKEVAFAPHEIRQKVLKLCAGKIKSNIERIITILIFLFLGVFQLFADEKKNQLDLHSNFRRWRYKH